MLILIQMKPLSPRQRQVLRLVAQERTDEQIARDLGISHHTVNSHLRKAFVRLGAQSRFMAVLKAIKRGELDLNELVA